MWWVKQGGEDGRLRPGLHGVPHFRDGEDQHPPYRVMGLGPPDQDLKSWGSKKGVPLQVCRTVSNWAVDGGARLDCLSMQRIRR